MRAEFLKRAEQAAWRAEGLASRKLQLSPTERKKEIQRLVDKFLEGLPEAEAAAFYHEVDAVNDGGAGPTRHGNALGLLRHELNQAHGDMEHWPAEKLHDYTRLSIIDLVARRLREQTISTV